MTESKLLQIAFRLMFQNLVLENTSASQTTPCILSCAVKCVEPCAAFFYNADIQQCLLSAQHYGKKHPGLKSEASWKLFKTSEVSPPCYPGYRDVTSVGLCVRFVTAKRSYSAAIKDCRGPANGRLVHLDTDAKIQAIDAIHRAEYVRIGFYIGLKDEPTYSRGDFRWTDGSRVTDNNWAPGQPDKRPYDDCVVIASWRRYQWLAVYCSDVKQYICEIVI